MLLPVTIHDFNASLHHSSTSLLFSSFLVVVGLVAVVKVLWTLWKWYSTASSDVVQDGQSTGLQEKALQAAHLSPYRSIRQLWDSVSNSLPSSERVSDIKQVVSNPAVDSSSPVMVEKALSHGQGKRRPLLSPTIYNSEVPASAAKLIMSRHTFRRPTPGAPRRSTLPASRLPQTQSMV